MREKSSEKLHSRNDATTQRKAFKLEKAAVRELHENHEQKQNNNWCFIGSYPLLSVADTFFRFIQINDFGFSASRRCVVA